MNRRLYSSRYQDFTLKKFLRDVREGRDISWQMLKRNLKATYRQSWLGFGWFLVGPLTTTFTFLILNMSGVIVLRDIPAPYPIFGLLSISLWQLFSNTLTQITDSLTNSAGLIAKVKFPYISLIMTSLGMVLVHFGLVSAVTSLAFILYLRLPSWTIILSPLFLSPLIFLSVGLGLFTSVFNVIIRDIKPLVGLAMGFLLYLMPVMYIQEPNSLLGQINQFNPLYHLIQTPRELILAGSIAQPVAYALSVLVSLVVFMLGLVFFYRTQKRIVERL